MKQSNGCCHPRSQFSSCEDRKLCALVTKFGTDDWEQVSRKMVKRNVRQCKERWEKYLSPSIMRCAWTKEEDALIKSKFMEFGSKWKQIAVFFPSRTDVMIRNRWNKLQRHEKANGLCLLDNDNNLTVVDSIVNDNNAVTSSMLKKPNNSNYIFCEDNRPADNSIIKENAAFISKKIKDENGAVSSNEKETVIGNNTKMMTNNNDVVIIKEEKFVDSSSSSLSSSLHSSSTFGVEEKPDLNQINNNIIINNSVSGPSTSSSSSSITNNKNSKSFDINCVIKSPHSIFANNYLLDFSFGQQSEGLNCQTNSNVSVIEAKPLENTCIKIDMFGENTKSNPQKDLDMTFTTLRDIEDITSSSSRMDEIMTNVKKNCNQNEGNRFCQNTQLSDPNSVLNEAKNDGNEIYDYNEKIAFDYWLFEPIVF